LEIFLRVFYASTDLREQDKISITKKYSKATPHNRYKKAEQAAAGRQLREGC